MRNTFLLLAYMFCLSANGQKFYSIEKIGNNYSKAQIEEAMNKADWCGYYWVSKRRKLTFDDGSVVELLKKDECSDSKSVNDDCFSEATNQDLGTYVIHISGVIIRTTSAANFSKN